MAHDHQQPARCGKHRSGVQRNRLGWNVDHFCDQNSNSFDRCGGGISFDLAEFFNDPDGTGSPGDDLEFYVYDDETTVEDDFYDDFITITPLGVLTYDPMSYMAQTTSNIPDWSLNGVVVYAQDDQESKAYSLKVNFWYGRFRSPLSEPTRATSPLTIRLNSKAKVFLVAWSSLDLLKEMQIELDSSSLRWLMEHAPDGRSTQRYRGLLRRHFRDGRSNLQVRRPDRERRVRLTVSSGDDGGSGMLGIILIVLAVLVLLGAGAFFFIEFEEVVDEDELTADDSAVEEDPYAWAKAKQTPAVPSRKRCAARLLRSRCSSSLSAPGWLWDQASNQWVPDPNYQQPPQ